jgi:hypothetical protein
MDKVAQVSTTAEASKVAGDIQKMKKQIIFKTKELKRDMEKRLCSNKPAVPGTDSVAGETAGIGAYLRTNVSRGAGGANPTLSGTTTGYPNAAPTDGTQRAFTEDLLKPVVQASWEAGAEPTHVIVGGFNKVQASGFTGNATRTKKAEDKKLVASIAVYESDFGELQIVPARLTVARQALILDPEYVEIAYLQSTQNTDLAKTGHSDRRMIWNEWMTVIGAENAHGLVADLTTSWHRGIRRHRGRRRHCRSSTRTAGAEVGQCETTGFLDQTVRPNPLRAAPGGGVRQLGVTPGRECCARLAHAARAKSRPATAR